MAEPAATADNQRLFGGLSITFLVVAFLAGTDLFIDVRDGYPLEHVYTEIVLLSVAAVGAVFMGRHWQAVLRRADEAEEVNQVLAAQLEATRNEAERFRGEAQDLVRGLSRVIDQQFERWGLSPAEQAVARLLLKGMSHKEIAELRSVSEATARQQARAVYKKSGLSGRHDLAAFFLEDLLGPRA
ncbi:MAG TPA: LuxR C-terminal-related transcriptional regulator [Polyangiaceae bacterium]|nr:LuxR C-terminal-related transcriptional regulator [Polyangiaceae bacterium]